MERKFLQNNWSEMRCQISEWWDDLTDDDLNLINGNQEQLIKVLQERYGYTRNLAFVEVKIRMAGYRPEGETGEKHAKKGIRALQYFRFDNDDWLEINNGQGFYGTKAKARARDLVHQ